MTTGVFVFSDHTSGQTHGHEAGQDEPDETAVSKTHVSQLISAFSTRQDASRERALAIVLSMRCAWLLLGALFFPACATEKPGSIGAHLSRDNETGAVYVRDLYPGLAGERAGLLPGDEIVMIDGFYVRELGAPRVREMLRGQVGTAVRLTIVRGTLVMRFRVARTELRDAVEEQPKPRVEKLSE